MRSYSLPAPHHDGSSVYVSNLSPELGEIVAVRVAVPRSYGPLAAVRIRANPDREPRWSDAVLVARTGSGQAAWDWWQADVIVENPRHGYRWMFQHESGAVEWLNQAGLSRLETLDAKDFALLSYPAPPEWLTESVMYQIFPDRFARSAAADSRPAPDWAIPARWSDPVDPVSPARAQQFYGGDLDGVTERLDHLDSLGVSVIYLTPIFPGASNHRYDAASFTEVDPLLGGDEALIRLVEAAHARGMRVIGDLTSNHSGDRHEWFQAAHGSPETAESDFYYFEDQDNTRYSSWLGVPSLPKFNWSSVELRRRFIEGVDSVVARWLKPPYSLDGWRIDVANMTGRLGDEDLNEQVRRTIRRTMNEVNPDTILLAESTNDAASDFQGDAWHGAMTYPAFTRPLWGWLSEPTGESWLRHDGSSTSEPWFFGQPIGGIPRYSARDFVAASVRFTACFPWRVRLGNMNPLDTHDTARFRTHAAPGTVPLALGLSVAMPGIPVVFAGDEFGVTGADGESSRTPVPWGSESDPVVAEALACYRQLLGLRRDHTALRTGGLRWLYVDEHAAMFVREAADGSVLVLASRVDVDLALPAGALIGTEVVPVLLTGNADLRCDDQEVSVRASGPIFAAWQLPGITVPWSAGDRSRHDLDI